jgi:outer membrane protein OmpA-like peptidoglycan-associated protein
MMRRTLLGTVPALLVLGACAPDPTQSSFFREAGQAANDGGFGNATLNNLAVQSGERDYAVALSSRFAETVPTTINFAFDSAALDAQARAALDRQADFILQFPEVRFAVYGHTDLVGSNDYNYRLGLRRAQAAVAYLVSRGISQSRLEALVSQGETMPLVAIQAPERANRRTVTDVTGFVEAHQGELNGKYAEIIFRDYVASAGVPETTQGITGAELATEQ